MNDILLQIHGYFTVLMTLFTSVLDWVVLTVQGWGYWGIIILMSIESSFIPFPSEVVLIPAGYLAHQGQMSIPLIWISSLIGSLVGAFINYFLASWVGRTFLERYGKYLFISPSVLKKSDIFFEKYGAVATLTGRLLPGIRQLISLPAGLCRMNLFIFTLYTTIGAGAWSLFLILLGYFIGDNQEKIKEHLSKAPYLIIVIFIIILPIYLYYIRKKKSHK